jgi:hypothetical protein
MLGQRLAAMVKLSERCVDGLQIQQAQLRTFLGPDRSHPPRASWSVGTLAATTLLIALFGNQGRLSCTCASLAPVSWVSTYAGPETADDGGPHQIAAVGFVDLRSFPSTIPETPAGTSRSVSSLITIAETTLPGW